MNINYIQFEETYRLDIRKYNEQLRMIQSTMKTSIQAQDTIWLPRYFSLKNN